jgi:hypothetical protein
MALVIAMEIYNLRVLLSDPEGTERPTCLLKQVMRFASLWKLQ